MPAADRHSPALGDANSVADLQQRLKGWSWQDRPADQRTVGHRIQVSMS